MNKTFAAATMAVSLTVGGTAGAALFTPTLSGAAQEADPTVTDPTVTDSAANEDAPDHDRGHRGRKGVSLTVLSDVLGLEADEIRDAVVGGSTIAELAEANGVAVDDVIDALVAEAATRLDAKVAEGDLTQEEADEKLAEATDRITDGVNDGFELRTRRPGIRGFLRGAGDDVQELLGLTAEEIRTQLVEGATLAEVAEAQGVSVDELVDAMVADAEARIAEKVAAGDMTQEEADEKLAELTARITDGVENGFELRSRGGRGGHGPGGDRPGPDADVEENGAS